MSAIWQVTDQKYSYTGDLGWDPSRQTLKLWAPSADSVNVIIYDKDNPNIENAILKLEKGDRGVWSIRLDQAKTGLNDLTSYGYHFEVWRQGQAHRVLDPYAKSLLAWNVEETKSPSQEQALDARALVAKAAFVDPSQIGPQLTYAEIEGYEGKTDAIIYEVHVRDFTSDPSLADELSAPFGTFAAFKERLDYIQSLGVTHVQLLPVMSYYFANEAKRGQRLMDYVAQGVNYNWGYDPQSYFALTGMYSQNPKDPELRIQEFKDLVAAIHDRGMGVILDVVYNHTAQTHIFEAIEPHYYHFMNQDGSPRESFGGGRVGTTHTMAGRILTDSIDYWTREFKVDGFRFDMMGDHDAEIIQAAYDCASQANPKTLFLGEGWRTFVGDEGMESIQAADQDWMVDTDDVAVFSDDFRNLLKSGYPEEGAPSFLTGGPQKIGDIFANLCGRPTNFEADQPGDVVQYIEAHDNLTLYDVMAYSLGLDPVKDAAELLARQRLGNLLLLTSQGVAFIHAGQEYGRTKQFRHPDFVREGETSPHKSTLISREGIDFPYLIHDSYNASDAVNHLDWQKMVDSQTYPDHVWTRAYTQGLIALRRWTRAFRLGRADLIRDRVHLLGQQTQDQEHQDLLIAYASQDDQDRRFIVIVNADSQARQISRQAYGISELAHVLVDQVQAGTEPIAQPVGITQDRETITLDGLTGIVLMEESKR